VRIAILLSALTLSLLPGSALGWLTSEIPGFGSASQLLDSMREPFDLAHIALFAVAGLGLSLTRRWPLQWRDGVLVWLTLLACSLVSEAAQSFMPDRNGNWLDVRDDLIGAAIGIVVGMTLRATWARWAERRVGV
jgi:VanZ family protein